MFLGTLVGYVFQPVETKTKDDKSFHVMRVKVAQTKNNYLYFDCFVNESIFKYASTIEKDSLVLIYGDVSASAYINKKSEPTAKLHCQVKHIRTISKPQPKEPVDLIKEIGDDIPW